VLPHFKGQMDFWAWDERFGSILQLSSSSTSPPPAPPPPPPPPVPKLLIRKRYYTLFLIPVSIVQVTKLVQLVLSSERFSCCQRGSDCNTRQRQQVIP
jgi:hypothetical protein